MRVTKMTTDAFWKGESWIKGKIEDQGKEYCAQLYLRDGQARDYSCTCAEGNSYKGMCPHCHALYAKYQERGVSKTPAVTSQQARTMIREYTNREVADIMAEEEEGQVLFVPSLILGRDELKLEWKVGRGRFYIVRDLPAFVQAVVQGAFVEYGKNLAFHHRFSAFTPDSAPLVEFMVELVESYQDHYRQFKRGFGTQPAMRRVDLIPASRDRFFGLMLGRELEVEDARGKSRLCTVTEENPRIDVQVEKKGSDGILVSISRDIASFFGEHHLYICKEGQIFRCGPECSRALGVFMDQLSGRSDAPYAAVVNEKDLPLFYERVIQNISPYSNIYSPEVDLESYKPEELKARFYFDSAGMEELTMKPVLSYGDCSFHPVEDEKLPRTVCRDVPGEFRISRLITRYFQYKTDGGTELVIKADEEAVYRLLSTGMEEFMAAGEVYLSDSFKQLKVLPAPKITVGVKSFAGWLELDIDTGGMGKAEFARLLSGYHEKKKYYRLKGGEFVKLDDDGMMTVARLLQDLGIERSKLADERIKLPHYRALYLDSMLREEHGISIYRDQLFKATVRGMKSVEDSDYEAPPTLVPVLRGYQKTGFRWLRTLDTYGFGGILADDMGLGKTIQVIALLLDEALKEKGQTSLIICPASLVYNWENEIYTFAPSLTVRTAVGSMEERKDRLQDLSGCDVLITSYDLLKRDLPFYEKLVFRFEVIDEAQFIKNSATQSAKAVKAVKARTRFALTGTPIENRLSELWSIFDYLMPGFLFTYSRFKKDYELPIVRDQDEEALGRLHRLAGPFLLRRLKKDVLKELPEKLETVVYSRFEKEQKDLYTANAYELKQQLMGGMDSGDKLEILAKLTRLRQICCDPALCYGNYRGGSAKLETCMDLVKNGVEGGHKLLLFSQFTSMFTIIQERLTQEGIGCHVLTGGTPKEERLRMVDSFHKDDVPVFLISLKAGGTGLNLTAADIVIHYDPWWNMAVQNQATDRTHRIGQKKQVSVFRLIMKDTIEENIMRLQESKKDLAEQVITEGTVSLGALSREDLISLLG